MTIISPISYYAHYFVPGTPVNVYKQEKVFQPEPIAAKPVKEVIDEFRSALRTCFGG